MPKLNENYLQLKESYLFSEIAHRTAAYSEKASGQTGDPTGNRRGCYPSAVRMCHQSAS